MAYIGTKLLKRLNAALWSATRPARFPTSIGTAARSASDRHVGGRHSAQTKSSRFRINRPAPYILRDWLGSDVAFDPFRTSGGVRVESAKRGIVLQNSVGFSYRADR
jgi:hypothetical protein